jgi:hypothetical protein
VAAQLQTLLLLMLGVNAERATACSPAAACCGDWFHSQLGADIAAADAAATSLLLLLPPLLLLLLPLCCCHDCC